MKITRKIVGFLVWLLLLTAIGAQAGPATSAVRETAEFIMAKFGRGVGGQTVEEVTAKTADFVVRHGNEALSLLRKSGHAGFTALERAGANAPDVIKLYAKKGDEAIWIISEPKKLAIFLKHGDSAADALLKHPGISDSLIDRFGSNAAEALNSISRQSAQRLNMMAGDGILSATPRSTELFTVIRNQGDGAMDFIWKNKGSLAVASVLATFLADPQVYISGAKDLSAPLLLNTNWTLIIGAILIVAFLPFIVRSLVTAWKASKLRESP